MDFLTPEYIIRYGGIGLLILIVFAETGLFFGFFLPGDSLLFMTGLLFDSPYLPSSIILIWALLVIAAVAGSQVGFYFGKEVGKLLLKRENFFFNKKRLQDTHAFYEKHKLFAFILGRFLPVIRTFIPIVAGIVDLDKRQFITYNITGAFIWVSSMLFAGYFLGMRFPFLKDHVGAITIGMVVVSSIPTVISIIRSRRNKTQLPQ